jgi:hypothetical protein
MVISADFEKQKQYFVKKMLLLSKKLSLYRNIACKNCSSDEGLKGIVFPETCGIIAKK